jgi:hypothetical protein
MQNPPPPSPSNLPPRLGRSRTALDHLVEASQPGGCGPEFLLTLLSYEAVRMGS